MKDIYKLKLNEIIDIGDDTIVRRVPNGWIYKYKEYYSAGPLCCMIFIPYHEEFLGKDENGDVKIPPFKE